MEFNTELTDEINVTNVAVAKLLTLTADEDSVQGVRIFVSGGGCGGMTYGMTLVEEPTQFDTKWTKEGLNVFVDAVALQYLAGVEIDFNTTGTNQSFIFKNVFANSGGAGTCGTCGAAGGGGGAC